MVPEMPFPDNGATRLISRMHFDEMIWPEFPLRDGCRITAFGDRVCCRFILPGDHQDIPVGQHLDIMMQTILIR